MSGKTSSRSLATAKAFFFLFTAWQVFSAAQARAAVVDAYWIGASGTWTDGAKWSASPNYPNNGTPTGVTYNAIINSPGTAAYTVSLPSSVSVDSILLNSANATLQISSGTNSITAPNGIDVEAGAFQLSSGAIANTRIYGSGGSVSLAGTLTGVTLDHSATINDQRSLCVRGGLVLNDVLTLISKSVYYTPTTINFDGSQMLTGNGAIVFDGYDGRGAVGPQSQGGTLTIDSGITIRTGADGGQIGRDNYGSNLPGLINRGLISAQTANKTLTVTGNWVNQGVMEIRNNSLLELAGTYSAASLGTINNLGGTLVFDGAYNNVGQNLVITPEMGKTQITGTIKGGTLDVAPGANLLPGGGTFDGVTINCNYTAGNGSGNLSAIFSGGFHNNAVLQTNSGTLYFGGTFTNDDLGDVRNTNGTIYVTGFWEMANDKFDFNKTTGSWNLWGPPAAIHGGTLTSHDAATLTIIDGKLDNVTLGMRPIAEYQRNCSIVNGLTFLAGGGVDCRGTLTFANTQMISGAGDIKISGNISSLGVASDSTLTIGPDVTISGSYQASMGGRIVNQGKIASAPGHDWFTVSANQLQNDGTIEVPAGTAALSLAIGTGFVNNGVLRVSGGELRLDGSFTISQLGNFQRSGGTVSLSGTLVNTDRTLTLDSKTGSWRLFAGGAIAGGRVVGNDGTSLSTSYNPYYSPPGGGGRFLNGVVLDIDIDQTGDTVVSATGGLTINRRWTMRGIDSYYRYTRIDFNGTQTLQGVGTIAFADGNAGAVRPTSGTLTIGPDITICSDTGGGAIGNSTATGLGVVNQGLISARTSGKTITVVGNGASFTNSGVLEARNGGTILVNDVASNLTGTQLTGGSWRAFANSAVRIVGADIRTNAAEIVLDGPNADFYNAASGSLSALTKLAENAPAGRLVLRNGRNFTTSDGFVNNGTVSVGIATTLDSAGGLENTLTGNLTGAGVFRADIVNSGAIAPAGAALPTAVLSIQGSLTEQPSAQLLMDMAGISPGSQFDKLNVSGSLHFDGTLRVALSNGFTPAAGSTFDLFDFSSADGRFSMLDLPVLPGRLQWDTSSLYSEGVLSVVPEPTTLTLLAAGLLGLLLFARQKRR